MSKHTSTQWHQWDKFQRVTVVQGCDVLLPGFMTHPTNYFLRPTHPGWRDWTLTLFNSDSCSDNLCSICCSLSSADPCLSSACNNDSITHKWQHNHLHVAMSNIHSSPKSSWRYRPNKTIILETTYMYSYLCVYLLISLQVWGHSAWPSCSYHYLCRDIKPLS